MESSIRDILRNLPAVDRIFREPSIKALAARYPKKLVMDEIRDHLKALRTQASAGTCNSSDFTMDAVCAAIVSSAEIKLENSLKRAINGAGIILHTGMGRASFAPEAQKALLDAVSNYCTLQIDSQGHRGNRDAHVEELLRQITGAEAATIVNNNAAATMLVLNTLAEGREVVVSRGQLVEIGGAFRIPDVMKRSNALMVEVGCTNRTHLKDYKAGLSENTGCILHVHKSNYAIVGFTKDVELSELADLAHSRNIPLFDDLGSGSLVDLSRWGLPHEPTVQDCLAAGADIVSFSGDKLLGGPQAGIIVGKKELVDRIRDNQLSRALRCDKMTYAVLEATLRLFLDEEKLMASHPVLRMMTETVDSVKERATGLKRRLRATVGDKAKTRVVDEQSEVGSGSMTLASIPTAALEVKVEGMSPDCLAAKLRASNPPVYGRIKNGAYLLDCRTIRHEEIGFVLKAFEKALGPRAEAETA